MNASPPPRRPVPPPNRHPGQTPPARPTSTQNPQKRSNPPHRHPLTPEEIRRRQAYLAHKRAVEARKMRIRLTICALVGILLLALLVMLLRGCTHSTPTITKEQTTETTLTTTTAESTTTPPPETTPEPEPPPLPVEKPSVTRPVADKNTVHLTEEIDSGYAALIAPERGLILAEKGGVERMYPASMTKIMTILVAYEHAENLDDTFTVTSAIIDPVYKEGASLAGFSPGETVTVRDLLYGTALPSGAEAAVSLAIYTAGSEEAFVELMNEKATELGLANTHFTNCVGLHSTNHYSTAVEIAMILDYTMQYEECRTILSTYEYTSTPTEKHPEGVTMHSTMLSRMYGDEPDGVTITAGKTGYTPEAGQCLASYASDDETGEVFILVTADAEGKFEPVFDAILMYSDYAE